MGYWTLSGSYSHSYYTNTLDNHYRIKGDGRSALLNVEHLILRNQRHQLVWNIGLANKEGTRDIAGVALQPDTSTTARLGLRWMHRGEASWMAQINYVQGTSWLGADRDPHGLPDTYPHHQFNKVELQAQHSRVFLERWLYTGQWQAQYTHQGLIGGEQIVLGGNDSVRGFATSSAFGDTGLSWRNRAARACWSDTVPGLQCFGFSDAGLVRSWLSPPMQKLVGAGFGMRLDHPYFFAEASAAFPLYASRALDLGHGELYVQIGTRY